MSTTLTPEAGTDTTPVKAPEPGTPDPTKTPAAPILNPSDPSTASPPKDPPGQPPREPPKPDPATPVRGEDLTLPSDFNGTIDPAIRERIAAIASERGLSKEIAQAVLESTAQEVASHTDAILKSYQPGGAEWTKQSDAWKAETLADPKLGTTPQERTAAIQRGVQVVEKYVSANPEDGTALKAFLNETGFGNHPTAVRFLAWLGKAAGEGSWVNPSAPSSSKTPAIPGGQASREDWFPNTPGIGKVVTP